MAQALVRVLMNAAATMLTNVILVRVRSMVIRGVGIVRCVIHMPQVVHTGHTTWVVCSEIFSRHVRLLGLL
jgi:hypothetical protein